MLCVGRAKPGGRLASVPGKAGAPALVGLSVLEKLRGSPLRRIASSYRFKSGGSYIRPVEARSTVLASLSSDQEKPKRGAKLFLSVLKPDDSGLAANARASGTLN